MSKEYAMSDAAIKPATVSTATGDADAAAWTTLRATAAVFVVAVLFHNGDHVRRGGESVSTEVFWVGSAAILLEVAIVALAMVRHPAAPVAAAYGGFGLALGYFIVHFTPERSFFSDAFPGSDVGALSWTAGTLETLSAIAVGTAGALVLRRVGASRWRSPFSVAAALRHPLVALFAAGNAAIFVLSFADRYL